MKPTSFTSVHDYLDALFEGLIPNEQDIINAKKSYWRAYNTDLKRRKRKQFPTFQISISKQDVIIIKSRLEKGEPISAYIYQLVITHLHDKTELPKKVNTALIEQQLFLIAEYLKELLDYEQIDTEKITQLESYIQTLENVIQESL